MTLLISYVSILKGFIKNIAGYPAEARTGKGVCYMVSQKISKTREDGIGEVIPQIVQTACAFKSVITFEVNDKHVNAKSIMGVMALASQNAPQLQVTAEGEDEAEAVHAIVELIS